jgi:hypothetical protein
MAGEDIERKEGISTQSQHRWPGLNDFTINPLFVQVATKRISTLKLSTWPSSI